MKKIIYATVGALALFATSCKKEKIDQGQKELVVSSVVDTLKGDITVNTTVTKTTYLKGVVYVKPGVTLTVNAGVTIKGSPGSTAPDATNLENNKGTLVVEKGAKLIANGTANSPIIWTSSKPAGSRDFGDWGGVVLMGNAPIVTTSGATTNTFEGLFLFANTGGRNSYGGTSPADNSGSMTYNRIDFAGGVVSAVDKEVNGLTFCGVGNGTTINHIEVTNSGDDSYEWFGGTVNGSYLVAYGGKDDDFDFDEGFTGRLQFIIGYRTDLADNSGSHSIELDNNAGTTIYNGVQTLPFISNATLIGPASAVARVNNLAGVPIPVPSFLKAFQCGVYVRRSGLIRLANSLIISQAMPTAFASTASTNAALLLAPTAAGASAVVNNLFQVNDTLKVVQGATEKDPIVTSSTINNVPLLTQFGTWSNTFLANYGAFKLGAALQPVTGSPALSGGMNLAAYGFVGTTQRGAVLTTNIWTAQPWITTAIH